MTTCILCDQVLTEANDSEEHVFPNAIGGILVVRGLLCRRCNSTAGHDWDAALARQLNPWTIFFQVVGRRNGVPPSQRVETTRGEKLLLHANGQFSPARPTHDVTETASGAKVQISARARDEARAMLPGFKRRFPNIDIEKTLAGATQEISYPQGMIRLPTEFGGEKSGRSIVKTTLAFAHHCGVDLGVCDGSRAYLREADGFPCFGYYWLLLRARRAGEPARGDSAALRCRFR